MTKRGRGARAIDPPLPKGGHHPWRYVRWRNRLGSRWVNAKGRVVEGARESPWSAVRRRRLCDCGYRWKGWRAELALFGRPRTDNENLAERCEAYYRRSLNDRVRLQGIRLDLML